MSSVHRRSSPARALTACLLAGLALSPAARAEDFGGTDKALHLGATAGIAAAAYAGAALLGAPAQGRLTAALAFALAAGVGKELLDVRGLGSPSAFDLAWDLVGAVTAAAAAYLVDWLCFLRPAESAAR